MAKILIVTEWNPVYDDVLEEYFPDEPRTFQINLDLIDKEDSSYRYVESIIDAAIKGVETYYSSVKYSFSDTPDWWDDITVDKVDTEDTVYTIDVMLNH